jgi:hypothetical protein
VGKVFRIGLDTVVVQETRTSREFAQSLVYFTSSLFLLLGREKVTFRANYCILLLLFCNVSQRSLADCLDLMS